MSPDQLELNLLRRRPSQRQRLRRQRRIVRHSVPSFSSSLRILDPPTFRVKKATAPHRDVTIQVPDANASKRDLRLKHPRTAFLGNLNVVSFTALKTSWWRLPRCQSGPQLTRRMKQRMELTLGDGTLLVRIRKAQRVLLEALPGVLFQR